MFAAEIVVGVLADSAGVVADSLDMLADAFVYAIALYAIGQSPSIKAAVAKWSGCLQIALATSLVLDVVRRAVFGSEPGSWSMLVVSGVALGANAYCLVLLAKHREGEVHMRASWIFTRSDVIANTGVIVAALLVALTKTRWPDLLVGGAIAGVVIKGGFAIFSDAKKERPNQAPQTTPGAVTPSADAGTARSPSVSDP